MENKLVNVESFSASDPRPLSSLLAGERGTLVGVTAENEALRKMASLGFTPGTEIAMVQNPRFGALIVTLRSMRVAIGRGEAEQITVRRFP